MTINYFNVKSRNTDNLYFFNCVTLSHPLTRWAYITHRHSNVKKIFRARVVSKFTSHSPVRWIILSALMIKSNIPDDSILAWFNWYVNEPYTVRPLSQGLTCSHRRFLSSPETYKNTMKLRYNTKRAIIKTRWMENANRGCCWISKKKKKIVKITTLSCADRYKFKCNAKQAIGRHIIKITYWLPM